MTSPEINKIAKKAFEISYVLVRIAASIRQNYLREEIEKLAISLVLAIGSGNTSDSRRVLRSIQWLFCLLDEVGLLSSQSSKKIIADSSDLDLAMEEYASSDFSSNKLPENKWSQTDDLNNMYKKADEIFDQIGTRQQKDKTNGKTVNGKQYDLEVISDSGNLSDKRKDNDRVANPRDYKNIQRNSKEQSRNRQNACRRFPASRRRRQ